MLSKSKRLNLRKDFKWAASGNKIDTGYAKLFIRLGENNKPKIGIATSASIFKKSSQRNRARRIVSAAFEALYQKLPQAINIVALPKSNILDVKSQDVLFDLEEKLIGEKIIS